MKFKYTLLTYFDEDGPYHDLDIERMNPVSVGETVCIDVGWEDHPLEFEVSRVEHEFARSRLFGNTEDFERCDELYEASKTDLINLIAKRHKAGKIR